MRLHIISDLHLEFHNTFEPNLLPLPEKYDCRILSGDITNGTYVSDVLKRIGFNPDSDIWIPGNHEHYDYQYPLSASPGTIVKYYDDHKVVIIANTAWTDYNLYGNPVMSKLGAQMGMADFRYILQDYSKQGHNSLRATPDVIESLHHKAINEISEAISKVPTDYKIVLVTHHPLSPVGLHERFKGSTLNPAFFSDYDEFLNKKNICLHVHGHIHNSVDAYVGNTRVVCNPRGYDYVKLNTIENPDFKYDLIVEV